MSDNYSHGDCSYDLGRDVFKQNMGAGDRIKCPRCGNTYDVSEHSNGWQDWYEFDLVETATGEIPQ